ncbi:cytochrome P450 [Biformimicrobium ophioploci]|uniref:Steroid C26-monooxygenase Cyp142 n=1 Tax=Biformimicrobium ophioploci TaxID=3036711 RepID=A0ABQ6M217_9GAMM|nr:cytochrome P450 [Microbulbifer sp. NKW57]GMG88383.1 steroid C26-monooxygenase Cyp142 [Microbulbifer sp. NKW57]
MTEATLEEKQALDGMSLLDNETLKCPYHYDKTLRENAPVYQDPTSGVYVVSTYELVREAHRNPKVFTNDFALAKGADESIDPDIAAAMSNTYDLGKGTLLTIDDPQHKIYRDELKDFFLAKNLAKYRPWITEFASKLVADLPRGEAFNFVEKFTRTLPLSVIMHVLGMPLEMRDLAFKWTVDNVTVFSKLGDKETLLAAHAGLKDEYDWFVQALDERRANPRDDLLSLIAHATYEGRPLTIEEQLSHCTQFLVAGNETTTATLAEGMRQLCLNPDQQRLIREDRSLIPNLVEESLRIASPTSNMWRVVKEDYNLGGTVIPKDSMVLLKYFSSNHDEDMFENPMRFDITRKNVNRHIAFGFGSHVCIGQHLSKLEMIVAWEILLENSNNFRLGCNADDLEYMPHLLLRGLEEIPVIIE